MRVRVRGHKLQGRGAPYTGATCQGWPCNTLPGVQRVDPFGKVGTTGVSGHGHALCECGWTGPHQLTGAARRRDHRAHRKLVRQR